MIGLLLLNIPCERMRRMEIKYKKSQYSGFQNRRNHKRIQISSSLSIAINGIQYDSTSENISLGGILIVVSDAINLKKGDNVVLNVSSRNAPWIQTPVQLLAEVKWMDHPGVHGIRAGLSFNELTEKDFNEIIKYLEDASEVQECVARGEWKMLHALQKEFDPCEGIDSVCRRTMDAVKKSQTQIGYAQCHIWYYDPGKNLLVWQAGHGATAQNNSFKICNEKLRRILVEKKNPILKADDFENIEEMPPEIWLSDSNWIFPLSCRDEFFGLLCFSFNGQFCISLDQNKQFWFCYSLANYLAQAIERCESSNDNHLRLDILGELPKLIHEVQMEKVYGRIIENMCGIVGCNKGVFRLYDPIQNLFTICAKYNIGSIDKSVLSYKAGMDEHGSCPNPQWGAKNPDFCHACKECRDIMGQNIKSLRIRFWDIQKHHECIGQVCCFVEKDMVLEDRLIRRIKAVASSLSAVMETALHQVISKKVTEILKNQRKIASSEDDTHTLLKNLIVAINTLMKAEASTLLLADPQGKRLWLEATTCKSLEELEPDDSYDINDENHLTSLVAKGKKAIAIPDTKTWHDDKGVGPLMTEVDGKTSYSFLGVPLFREGDRISAVIRCSNKKDKGIAAFNRHDIDILSAIAESCAPLILATTVERGIRESLGTAGHEVGATASIIARNANLIIEKKIDILRKYTNIPKDIVHSPLDGIYYDVKGIRDSAAMISIFQDDLNVSLSNSDISWNPRPTNLGGDVIAQVVDMLREQASKSNIYIDYDSIHTLPVDLSLDPLRMKQLFYNLLSNAIKYNRKKSITKYSLPNSGPVTIQRGNILIRWGWSSSPKAFWVSIIGDGRQVFEEEKDQIWENGFRGKSVKRLQVGRGIGMYVAKRIENSTSGLKLELTSLFKPVVFTVKFTEPILK